MCLRLGGGTMPCNVVNFQWLEQQHIYTIGFEFHFVLPVCASLYPTLLDLYRNHSVGKLLFRKGMSEEAK
jgi:hypothetical protein